MSISAVHTRTRGRGAAFLITAGVCWGTGGLAGSVLVAHGLHPLSVAAYRLLLGGVLVVLFLLVTSGVRIARTNAVARRLGAAGALLATFQACYFSAVSLTSVSLATMVTIGSVPVFVTGATSVRTRRLPSGATVLALVAAVLGLLLLTWAPVGVDGLRFAGGMGCALLAGAGFAAVTLLTRRQVDGLDALHTAAFGCLAGGALLVPLGLVLGMGMPLRVEPFVAVIYLGAVPTAVAYAAYFTGLRDSHPVLAALSALLEPLTAALLAAFLLSDRLGVTGWCGAALLVAALAVSQLRRE